MEKIKPEDFGQEPFNSPGYYLFRNKRSKVIRAGEVDTVFDTITIVGESSINLTTVSFEGAVEYLKNHYDWFRIPCDYRDH